ncbi:MAG TPA: hypothetical protein DCG57_12275 [Candidatus Riflebacteria bacterium]|nr:hypothetical protein [Candidatus Riflebacteria bacterium]
MNGEPTGNDSLTRDALFRMFTDEACRDGVLEDFEQKILLSIARFLRLEKEEAGRILNESRERFEQGQLGETRRFEPRALYLRVLQGIYADGQVDNMEEQMLAGLRKMFNISAEDHEAMLKTFILPAANVVNAPLPLSSPESVSETALPQQQSSESEESEMAPPQHLPGSTTRHLAERLEINRQQIWFNEHCNWYHVQRQISDQAQQAWDLFIDGLLQGNESVMYQGLDQIDDILNDRGSINTSDVLLALGVLRWSRVLLKTTLSQEKFDSARVWPLHELYARLSVKMGPILISIDELRIRNGLEEWVSRVFVFLLEDLSMLLECCHAKPISYVFAMLRMLFRVSPKAGITHRAADLLKLLAESAARQGGDVLTNFIFGCKEICGLQPQNHPLVIVAYQALQAIAPEKEQLTKNYQPPVSRPSVNQPEERALQRLDQLISDATKRLENEHQLISAFARIDLSFLDRVAKGLEEDAAKEGFDARLMQDRYVVVMLFPELPDYPRPLIAFFSLGDPSDHHEELKGGWPRILLEKEHDNRLRVHPDFALSPSTVMLTLPSEAGADIKLQSALHASGGAYDIALVSSSRKSARIWHLVGDLDPTGNLYRVERDLLPADNNSEALRCLDEAFSRQPWLSGALLHKGLIAKRAGDKATARKLYEEALAAQPYDPNVLTRMGVLEKNEDQFEKCNEYLLRSLRILPVQPSAMVTLGSNMLSFMACGDSSALPLWDYYIAGLHANQSDGKDYLEIAEISDDFDSKLSRNARVVPVDTVFYL